MFDRVTIRASDLDGSRRFYETLLGSTSGELCLVQGPPVTRHLHIAFVARSREEVDARWRRAIDAGYESGGEPGVRPEYHEDYYGGFLFDPDGNSAEIVYHGRQRDGDSLIDHLWLGVGDLAAAKRLWSSLAPELGLRIAGERPERFHVAGDDRSFALVQDGRPPTEHVQLAFPGGMIVEHP